jgi:hypothetical protein
MCVCEGERECIHANASGLEYKNTSAAVHESWCGEPEVCSWLLFYGYVNMHQAGAGQLTSAVAHVRFMLERMLKR